jgi:outer membrane biogenesis lipoprotein LolB
MKIFNMKLLVVFALLYCIVLTACPKDTAVRKAARASGIFTSGNCGLTNRDSYDIGSHIARHLPKAAKERFKLCLMETQAATSSSN